MNLEFSELNAFVVLAGELHFRKAAERLFLSQPALSKKIQRLEEKLRGALFVRSRRRVALTDAGKSFLPKVAKLLQEAEDALRETQAAVEGRAGTLRIGFGIASLPEILPRSILRFRKLHPDVELQMREMPSPSQVSSLIESRLDVGILRMPVTNPKLISVPLFSEHLVLATPADVRYRPKEGINGFRDSGFIFVSPFGLQNFSRSRAKPLPPRRIQSPGRSGSKRNLNHPPLGSSSRGGFLGPEVGLAPQSAGSAIS
jgi:DNA-binding transcriptional LysR family regulator